MGTVVKEIADIEQIIQRELSVDGWTNAYLSFAKGGALSVHYDPHDVLVIQVEGRKRWRLYGQTEQTPVRPMRITDPGPDTVVEEHALDPGDLLFVPRGVWHRAELESPTSIHLTFALEGFTGVDLVKTLVGRSELEELFRRYAPRTADRTALQDWEQQLKARLHELVDGMSLSAELAKGDSETRARQVSRFGLSPDLAEGTILRTALCRSLHGAQWREPAEAILGGVRRSLTKAGRLALQAIDHHTIISFGVVAAALETEGLDRELSAGAVIELVGQGLVIIEEPGG
jgi:quercetin dioxygenase-like cupin family protein